MTLRDLIGYDHPRRLLRHADNVRSDVTDAGTGAPRGGPARMLKDAGGIPARGNQRSEWEAGRRFDFDNPDYR